MDRKTGKKRKWNIGSIQPTYDALKNENRSDRKGESEQNIPRSRLKRKQLLKNGKEWH